VTALADASKAAFDEQLTLAWVNGARAAMGEAALDEMPANVGVSFRRSHTCPVATALPGDDVEVGHSGVYKLGDRSLVRYRINGPLYVMNTVRRYDLELKEQEIA
jgi:hypothetical protein